MVDQPAYVLPNATLRQTGKLKLFSVFAPRRFVQLRREACVSSMQAAQKMKRSIGA